MVARGTVYLQSSTASLVHGEKVAVDNVKVAVDDVVCNFQNVTLRVPSYEITRISEALGTFVQWPKNLVTLGQVTIPYNCIQIQTM